MKRGGASLAFVVLHLAAMTGWRWADPKPFQFWQFLISYSVLSLGITLGYHRYLAHGAFRASPALANSLTWLGCTAIQKSPLWWVSVHRHHHRHADREEDPHSPRRGLYWAHLAWNGDPRFARPLEERLSTRDKTSLMLFLDAYPWAPALVAIALLASLGGWTSVYFGFVLSSVLVIHATCAIGSLAHRIGYQSQSTNDGSRNHWLLGFFFWGEGWHNNHHADPASAFFGRNRFEIDPGYAALRILEALGLAEVPLRVTP